jgi:hypothetical protein
MAKELPIACSLEPDAATERLGSFADLAGRSLIDADRTHAGGIELRFRRDDHVEQALIGFIEAERQCCPFLDFELARGSELRLRIGGPAEAQPVLDAFLGAAASD